MVSIDVGRWGKPCLNATDEFPVRAPLRSLTIHATAAGWEPPGNALD